MLAMMWSKQNPHSLLMEMQNGTGALEDSLAVSYKTKHTLKIWSSNRAPWYLPKEAESLCSHKNLHTIVYSSFIQNCQNLEVTKMAFSREKDKLWYIQTMEEYSALKRNELPSQKKTWRNIKCIFVNERSQSEKATYCKIPTVWHSGKGKTMEAVKRSVVARGWQLGEGWIGGAQRTCRAVKLLCMIV